MQRAIGAVVFLTLLGGAVAVGRIFGPNRDSAEVFHDCHSFSLCADEGLVEASVLVESCSSSGACTRRDLENSVFLGFIQLDGPPDERCGPGDCGAVPDALFQGWRPGRWKIVAPDMKGLEAPDPVMVDLEAGETESIELLYRDP